MTGLVIFDCDGALVDSDRISFRIQADRISALGLEMAYEECARDFLGPAHDIDVADARQARGTPSAERVGK